MILNPTYVVNFLKHDFNIPIFQTVGLKCAPPPICYTSLFYHDHALPLVSARLGGAEGTDASPNFQPRRVSVRLAFPRKIYLLVDLDYIPQNIATK